LAVRLRLRRIGKKKKPMYQIVAADSRAARTGKFVEIVGRYDPLQHPPVISTKEDRVLHWLNVGARPTETVRSLLQRTGLWMRWSLKRKGLSEAALATEMEKWEMLQVEKRKKEESRRVRGKPSRRKAKPPAGESAGAAAPPAAAETPAQA
jgi:small subunit ribosomal protein S16